MASSDKESKDRDSFKIRRGAYLPHLTLDGSTYSVTFRLADSLPQSTLKSWIAERNDIILTARQMGRPLSRDEELRLRFLFSEKVDKYLDAGYGACWMKRSHIEDIVESTLRHFDGSRYELVAWCVMPNHAHSVLRPAEGCGLESILHSWKSYSAKQANKDLGRRGDFWHAEYYDHLIRDAGDLAHCVQYVFSMRLPIRKTPG